MKVVDNKTLLRLNDKTVSLFKHRNLKRKLVSKKNQLNYKKQKLDNLNYQIKHGAYKLCFDAKYLLKRDYNEFIARRDSQLSFELRLKKQVINCCS